MTSKKGIETQNFSSKDSTFDQGKKHFFSLHMKMLGWIGIRKLTPTKSRLVTFIQGLLFLNLWQYYIAMLLNLFLKTLPSEVPFKVCLHLTLLSIMYTFNNAAIKNKKLREILDETDKCVKETNQPQWKLAKDKRSSSDGHNSKWSINGWVGRMDRISSWCIKLNFWTAMGILMVGTINMKMMGPSWYYFDQKSVLVFALVSLVQYPCAAVLSLGTMTHLTLYIKLALTICSQLDCVTDTLFSIQDFSGGEDREETHTKRATQTLRMVIRHHQRLIRILYDMKSFYDKPLFILFSSSAVDLCFCVYVFLTLEELNDSILVMMLVFVNQFTQMLFFCVFGNMLSERVARVSEAAYFSGWVDCDTSFRRSILIVMNQSTKEFELTAWWFAAVSLPALAQILQDAGSYVMIMIAITD